jgi:hypothetical protein
MSSNEQDDGDLELLTETSSHSICQFIWCLGGSVDAYLSLIHNALWGYQITRNT